MSEIFAVETPTGTAGLAVRTGSGFRFHASDHAFAELEARHYQRIEELRTDINRLVTSPRPPRAVQQRGSRKRRDR